MLVRSDHHYWNAGIANALRTFGIGLQKYHSPSVFQSQSLTDISVEAQLVLCMAFSLYGPELWRRSSV